MFQRLRSLICPELKNVSPCRRGEKLPVATVTCRSDQSRGSGNFSREHFDNFQEGAAAAAHQSRGAWSPSRTRIQEQIQDPGSARWAEQIQDLPDWFSSVNLPSIDSSLTTTLTSFLGPGLCLWRSFSWQQMRLKGWKFDHSIIYEFLLHFKIFFFFISLETVTPSLNRITN